MSGYTANAVATIVDVETGGVIAFSSATYTVAEDGGSATITVTRTAGSTTAATVDYATANGSATAGADYTATSGTLNFAAGQTTASFDVPILDDAALEDPETFALSLSNPTGGASLGAIAAATVTIEDDEVPAPGTVGLTLTAIAVEEGDGVATLTVTRSGGSDGAVSVAYATADGTATAPADYASTAGTLSWADGDATPRSISVPIVDDADEEGAETFAVTLSGATGDAALGASSAQVTIAASDVSVVPSAAAPAVIPVFGDLGRVLLGGLIAFFAWLGLRRRGDGGALAVLLAVGATLSTAPADAAERQRVREPARFTIATVDAVGSDIVLRATDGSTQRIAATALQVRGVPGEARGVSALAVGKVVLLRTDGKGEGKHRAWVVDSAAEAAALRDRKLARKVR